MARHNEPGWLCSYQPGSGVTLRGVLVAAAVVVCLPVAGAVASVFGSVLVAAVVMVYAAVIVAAALTVRLLMRTAAPKPVKVAAATSRALPAPPLAIGAPKVYVLRPEDVIDGARWVRRDLRRK